MKLIKLLPFRHQSQYHCKRITQQHRFFGSSSSPTLSESSAIDYCVSLVKTHDFDSYLAGLLVPKTCRHSFFAVRAFHVELALIKDQARRNALTGRVRFQFWRDVLAQTFSNDSSIALDPQETTQLLKTPVARALQYFANDYRPVARYFGRALDARCVLL
jgi:NADH dehydrogenase [ubiquinone] 1 alpha subcomplex assembly factor 6